MHCEIYWSTTSLKGRDINISELLNEMTEKEVLWVSPAASKPEMKNLGKYRLTDILEFNKKGRNHF